MSFVNYNRELWNSQHIEEQLGGPVRVPYHAGKKLKWQRERGEYVVGTNI